MGCSPRDRKESDTAESTGFVAVVTQLGPTLCDPTDYSPPGSSVHGISQARILEWVAISSSRDLPDPGIQLANPHFL